MGAGILSASPNPCLLFLQTALHLAAILGEASTLEKLYAAGAGLLVAERGGHTALHLACRVGAHTCARVLLQRRPQRARGAPNTYLTQGPDRAPDTDHTSVAMYPEPDLEKEEDENEEDWKLQLEAENYEGEGPQALRRVRAPGSGLSSPDSTPSPLGNNTETSGTQALGPKTPAQAPDY